MSKMRCRGLRWLGLSVDPMSSATQPFDKAHKTSYSNLIETMGLSCTVFEILSLIFQKIKISHDSGHAPFRGNLSSVGWDLLCSTHIPNTFVKFCTQVYAISILATR